MSVPNSFSAAAAQVSETAAAARSNAFSTERAPVWAETAKAEAMVVLAYAVREAGSAIGAGLTAVARALERR